VAFVGATGFVARLRDCDHSLLKTLYTEPSEQILLIMIRTQIVSEQVIVKTKATKLVAFVGATGFEPVTLCL